MDTAWDLFVKCFALQNSKDVFDELVVIFFLHGVTILTAANSTISAHDSNIV